MYRRWGKRLLDLALAVPLLFLLAPLLALVGVVIRVKLGAPVLFRQPRAGLHGRVFTLHKFRSMTDQRDADGELLPDAERLTRLGRFLRSTSIDELPELVDVVRGKMSLVGPRPLLSAYVDRYSPEQRHRLDVKPGITGWAQVNGRNALTWEQKFALDVWYARNLSPTLDFRILGMTLLALLSRGGISQAGQATAEEFRGG